MSVIDVDVKDKFSHYLDVLLNNGTEAFEDLCEKEPHFFCHLDVYFQKYKWGQNGSEFLPSFYNTCKIRIFG